MNRMIATLLCLFLAIAASGKRLRRSHFTKSAITFAKDDPFSCSTPYRQPGTCVRIEACPELRRVSLRRLSKFLCGFEAGDIPLLCCDRQGSSTSPLTPPTLRPVSSEGSQPATNPNGQSRLQSVSPVPLLCSVSVHGERRFKSCWYLALQRVVYPESSDDPLPLDTVASTDSPTDSPTAATSGTTTAADTMKFPTQRPIGNIEPSKTLVTSV